MKKRIIILSGIGVLAVVGGALYVSTAQPFRITVDQSSPLVIANGKAIYEASCASCHGQNMEGQTNWQVKKADGTLPAPPHDKDGHTWHHNDGILFNYTKGGGESLGIKGFKSGMPPFKSMLDDKQIWEVLAYIKSRWPEKHRVRQALATEQAKQQEQN